MAIASQYKGDTGDIRPSPNIWADCPWVHILEGKVDGYCFHDDFVVAPLMAASSEVGMGLYKYFASAGGPIDDAGIAGGGLAFDSDDDNEGASLASAVCPFSITQEAAKLWFEAAFYTTTIADDKHGIFCGLSNTSGITLSATVPIAAAGTLADGNFVGFHRLEGDGDKLDTVYKANSVTQVDVANDAITLVASTTKRVGMVYDKTNDYKLTFYDDGVALADTKVIPDATGTDFPADVTLGFIFAVLNATGTSPGGSVLNWWRGAQLR